MKARNLATDAVVDDDGTRPGEGVRVKVPVGEVSKHGGLLCTGHCIPYDLY
jgi:hypothetical protein